MYLLLMVGGLAGGLDEGITGEVGIVVVDSTGRPVFKRRPFEVEDA